MTVYWSPYGLYDLGYWDHWVGVFIVSLLQLLGTYLRGSVGHCLPPPPPPAGVRALPRHVPPQGPLSDPPLLIASMNIKGLNLQSASLASGDTHWPARY